jgi:hypothetical protein
LTRPLRTGEPAGGAPNLGVVVTFKLLPFVLVVAPFVVVVFEEDVGVLLAEPEPEPQPAASSSEAARASDGRRRIDARARSPIVGSRSQIAGWAPAPALCPTVGSLDFVRAMERPCQAEARSR